MNEVIWDLVAELSKYIDVSVKLKRGKWTIKYGGELICRNTFYCNGLLIRLKVLIFDLKQKEEI